MTKQENKILEDVCQRLDIPLVGVRFGTVPEFTSKILSILALHNSHPSTLKCTMKCLLDDAGRRASCLVSPPRRTHTSLHIICVVPMTTQDLSLALEQRDRRHWCIIRVVVCTLWRSRLVSSDISSKVGHVNTLTFVFDDGVTLYLTEEAFVSKLASQHQAAPSEYQILAAIQTLLDSKPSPPKNSSKKVLASEIVDQVIQSSPEPITATISINPAAESGIWQQFYTAEGASKNTPLSHSSIIAILDIQGESFFGEGTTSKIRKMHRAIVRAAEKQNLLIYHDSVVMGNEDYEASCIICLQHMLYQNRFFTNSSTLSGKKRMNLHIQPTRSLTDHSSK